MDSPHTPPPLPTPTPQQPAVNAEASNPSHAQTVVGTSIVGGIPTRRSSHAWLCVGGVVSLLVGLSALLLGVSAAVFMSHDLPLESDIVRLVGILIIGTFLTALGIGLLLSFARARRAGASAGNPGGRNRVAAALLGVFFGGAGAHQFYMGNRRRGFVYLALCWIPYIGKIPWFIGMLSGFRYLYMTDAAFAKQENPAEVRERTKWWQFHITNPVHFAERVNRNAKPLTIGGRLWIAMVCVFAVLVWWYEPGSGREALDTNATDSHAAPRQSGALVIKGFRLGMSKDEAIAAFEKIDLHPTEYEPGQLAAAYSERGEVTLTFKGAGGASQKLFGRKNKVSAYIDRDGLKWLIIGPGAGDRLFNSADLSAKDFAQSFLNAYLDDGAKLEVREDESKAYWFWADPKGYTIRIDDDKQITWTRVPSDKERKFGG